MIPNACDLEIIQPGRREDLKLAGIAAGDFVAAYAGAHGIANGLDSVLDAAKSLLLRGRTDIKIALIGDGIRKPQLKKRAELEGLVNCLFYEPVPKTQYAHMLGCFDAGLMILQNVPAFYYGTSPSKFFDYISAGLPVVTNHPGWIADLVKAHQCGLAVTPERPDELAAALIRLADAHAEREKMRANARFLAEAQFRRLDQAERFVDWLALAYERYYGLKCGSR